MYAQKIDFVNEEVDGKKVHIIDDELERRVELARSLYRSGCHAELYETFEEYQSEVRSNGIVFVGSTEDLTSFLKWEENPFLYTPVVVYSSNPDTEMAAQAISDGAIDYLAWPTSDAHLEKRLIDIRGRIRKREAEEWQRSSARRLVKRLTRREHTVLECMVAGYSNKDIARVLTISPRTVEIHRSHLMDKLGVESSALAVRIGIYAGLDSSERYYVEKFTLNDLKARLFSVG